MFQPGELVVYGTTGVRRVEKIAHPNSTGPDQNKDYYLLKPLHQDGIIYTPVENAKIPMRPVISAEAAEALIDLIPTIQAEACHAPTMQALAQHYHSAIRNHDCTDLIELMMSIYVKQRQAESQKRRICMIDERYMKQAERLLYSELSSALGISYEQVQPYIAARADGLATNPFKES